VEGSVEGGPGERRAPARPLPSHRQWTPLGRGVSVLGDNWTLVIASELADGRTRLSDLRGRLANVSAGVLDRYVLRMKEAGLVTRDRFREVPPRVEVELTDAGRELLPIVAALSRWGLRWSWSEPRTGEIIDPGALLRSLPSLLSGPVESPDGVVELVLEERGGPRRQLAEIKDGAVSMWRGQQAGRAPKATARIAGDWRAWTAAFGPAGDLSGLRFSGRRSQGTRLMAAIERPQAEAPAEHKPSSC
jgi:DNA-binding HxlR family transcriptional regulator